MSELDNILMEVNDFDKTKVNMGKPVQHKPVKPEKVKRENAMNKETRNHMLKRLAFMGFIGGCAFFKLMHPVLYIPAEILALCSLCIKYGEWRGMKKGE